MCLYPGSDYILNMNQGLVYILRLCAHRIGSIFDLRYRSTLHYISYVFMYIDHHCINRNCIIIHFCENALTIDKLYICALSLSLY